MSIYNITLCHPIFGPSGHAALSILARSHSKTCNFGSNAWHPGQISPRFPMIYVIGCPCASE